METEDKVFIAIALVVAVCAHIFIRKFFIACIVIVFASPALYAVESFIRLKLPPSKIFWLPFMFLEGGFLALGIALVIGFPFYLFRRWRRHKANPAVP
jgi:hypothetical protein